MDTIMIMAHESEKQKEGEAMEEVARTTANILGWIYSVKGNEARRRLLKLARQELDDFLKK